MATEAPLSVIALVSGGKDSFYSILHVLALGHRVVALANLHPPDAIPIGTASGEPRAQRGSGPALARPQQPLDAGDDDSDEADLNSFMYQTVGHQIVPLYGEATGLPMFRQPIVGTAVQHGVSYPDPGGDTQAALGAPDPRTGPKPGGSSAEEGEDETESLVPLLRAVMKAHPEANALCTGAILSTYQRTRVESVALRLGLVPLAYLWQFPVLPIGTGPKSAAHGRSDLGGGDDAQLLRDMAAVGLDARMVKVASAGLDEQFLWENVASDASIRRVERALKRFGGGGRGSVLGEGGEFETLVVDGPAALFKGRIVVPEDAKRVVREGGGSSWLNILGATVETKTLSPGANEPDDAHGVRVPPLWEARFDAVLEALRNTDPSLHQKALEPPSEKRMLRLERTLPSSAKSTRRWRFMGSRQLASIEEQTSQLVHEIQQRLRAQSLPANAITGAVVVLRYMSDFPAINKLYGTLFREPNPPARVTIACGDGLPSGSGIAVYLTLQPSATSDDRLGLHVQSRSYWAPANIGPYSQAIAVSLTGPSPASDGLHADGEDVPRAVTIAGQIPLIPATMALPGGSSDSTPFQVALALQHLWRIAVEMRVQWWTSAVAYFPRSSAPSGMAEKALLAAQAWRTAHLWSADTAGDSDDEDGPDLWDRRHNPEYMTLTGADDAAALSHLPDWDVLAGTRLEADLDASRRDRLPFVFAAEVEELPRSAGVEWHAHCGLAKVGARSVDVFDARRSFTDASTRTRVLEMQHVVVSSGTEVFVHTATALAADDQGDEVDFHEIVRIITGEVAKSLEAAAGLDSGLIENLRPYLAYVDANSQAYSAELVVGANDRGPEAIIPCRSLWNAGGEKVSMVLLFENRFTKAQKG